MNGAGSVDDVAALRQRVAELEAAEAQRDRAEEVPNALYRIAETASVAEGMQDFYRRIHAIVAELMYADNFYIALYDPDRDMINFPYFIDEVDPDIPDPHVWEPYGIGNAGGITAYLLRKGSPMFHTLADLQVLAARGELSFVGEPSMTWSGSPCDPKTARSARWWCRATETIGSTHSPTLTCWSSSAGTSPPRSSAHG